MMRGKRRPRRGLTVLAGVGLGALVAGTLAAASLLAQQIGGASSDVADLDVATQPRVASEPIVLRAPSGSASAPSRSASRGGPQSSEIPIVSDAAAGVPVVEGAGLDFASGLPDLGVTGVDAAPSLPAVPMRASAGSFDLTELDPPGSFGSQLGMPSLIAPDSGSDETPKARAAIAPSGGAKQKQATKHRAIKSQHNRREDKPAAAGHRGYEAKSNRDARKDRSASQSASRRGHSKEKSASPHGNTKGDSGHDRNKN